MKDISVIIVAAGESKRLKTKVRKPYLILKGKPILLHSLDAFRKIPAVGEIVIAINPKDSERANKIIAPINSAGGGSASGTGTPRRAIFRHRPVQIKTVIGGAFRAESVFNALKTVSNQSKIVLIHDAARPFVKQSDIIKLIKEIRRTGSAILAIPVTDTIKRTEERKDYKRKNRIIIKETIIPRKSLWAAQTPQGFRRELLVKAYNLIGRGIEVTDDASLVERLGLPVSIIKSSAENIKITTKADIKG